METNTMKTFKGTKGKWETDLREIEFSKGWNTIEVACHNSPNTFLNDKWICQVNNVVSEEIEQNKANAKLIAAAPELLEALLNIKNDYPDEDFKSWSESLTPVSITLHGSDFKMILEAINKAL